MLRSFGRVAVAFGEGFEIAVGVVGVFGGVSEWVGDLDWTALFVAFGRGGVFRGFGAFGVSTRADFGRDK
jgi:hypothetical protein